MGKRKQGGVPVSLFSFQDIITSTCGILILIVLMFAIELTRNKSRSPDKTGEASLSEEIRSLEKKLEDINNAQAAAKKDVISNGLREYLRTLKEESSRLLKFLTNEKLETKGLREILAALVGELEQKEKDAAADAQIEVVSFIPGKGSKKPTLVECSGTHITVKGAASRSFAANDQQIATRFFIDTLNKNEQCLVLMFKPSAVNYAYDFAQDLMNGGITVGWDVLEENAQIQLSK